MEMIFIIAHRNEIKKKIKQSGIGIKRKEGKLSTEEFIDQGEEIINELYKKHKPKIIIRTVDDLRKFRNDVKGLTKELIDN